eukprot:gene5182-5257_t
MPAADDDLVALRAKAVGQVATSVVDSHTRWSEICQQQGSADAEDSCPCPAYQCADGIPDASCATHRSPSCGCNQESGRTLWNFVTSTVRQGASLPLGGSQLRQAECAPNLGLAFDRAATALLADNCPEYVTASWYDARERPWYQCAVTGPK